MVLRIYSGLRAIKALVYIYIYDYKWSDKNNSVPKAKVGDDAFVEPQVSWGPAVSMWTTNTMA